MNIVIVNTSKLRIALLKAAKKQNMANITMMFNKNNINSATIAKAENRFNTYKAKVSFNIDEYTAYGAFYEDVWEQIVSISHILNKGIFELEKIKPITKTKSYEDLEMRITRLEDTVTSLMKSLELEG